MKSFSKLFSTDISDSEINYTNYDNNTENNVLNSEIKLKCK